MGVSPSGLDHCGGHHGVLKGGQTPDSAESFSAGIDNIKTTASRNYDDSICIVFGTTPLSAKISASKFQNLSQIPLKIFGIWKNRGV